MKTVAQRTLFTRGQKLALAVGGVGLVVTGLGVCELLEGVSWLRVWVGVGALLMGAFLVMSGVVLVRRPPPLEGPAPGGHLGGAPGSKASLDSIPALFWLADVQGDRTYFSRVWMSSTGRSLNQEQNGGWWEGVHPDDRDTRRAEVAQAMAARAPFSVEYRLRMADGLYHPMLDEGAPRTSPTGAFDGYVGCCFDLAPLREAEGAARRSNEFFRVVASLAPTGIYRTDANGSCCFVSEWWLRLTGLTHEQAMGNGWTAALHPDDAERVSREWEEAISCRRDFVSQYRYRTPAGETRHVAGRATALRDERGQTVGYVGVVTDITESVQAQARLEQGLGRERVLIRELNHRVRNNLAGLLGLIGVYEQAGWDAPHLAEAMRSNIKALAEVQNLIARADRSGVDMGELLSQLRDTLLPVDARGLLTFSGPSVRLPPTRAGAMAMILQELITNSRKHGVLASVPGRVVVTWSVTSSQLSFCWREDREGPAAERDASSSSVGLSLVRGFAEMDLGGTCVLESSPTCWRVAITAELAPSVNEPPQLRPGLSGLAASRPSDRALSVPGAPPHHLSSANHP